MLYCSGMGQTINVSARAGARPEIRIFDLDRSLTGMAIESYETAPPASALRPPDVLARRLFEIGATSVTVYSSVVTVAAPAAVWGDIEAKAIHAITHLFNYYGSEAGWSPDALGIEAAPSPVQ